MDSNRRAVGIDRWCWHLYVPAENVGHVMLKFLTGFSWQVYVVVGGILLTLALGGYAYVEYLRLAAAEAKVAQVTLERDVESQHAKDALAVIDQLQEIKRRETESQQRLAQNKVSRDTTIAQIVKDTTHASDANQVAGPAFDALADGLRAAEGSHQ